MPILSIILFSIAALLAGLLVVAHTIKKFSTTNTKPSRWWRKTNSDCLRNRHLIKPNGTTPIKTSPDTPIETNKVGDVAAIQFIAVSNGILHILGITMAHTQATIDNTVTLTVAFTDSKGNPTSPASTPVWTADSATSATLAPAADGLSVVVSPTGALGTTNITATVGSVTGTASVTFVPGGAVAANVTAVVNNQ